MHSQGYSLKVVSAVIGRDFRLVSRKATSIGLHFERPDKRHYNPRVFVDINHDSAWLLGLIFADGTFAGPRKTIGLSSIDKDLVEKMQAIMETDHPIYNRDPSKGRGCLGKRMQYRLYVNGADLVESLLSVGIKQQKRERTGFPRIPNALIRDFVRGYFDGDGGISIKSKPQAYFAGPTEFAEVLRQHIQAQGIQTSKLYLPKQTTGLGTFHIWNQDEMLRLYHYLYDDATVYGERKYQTWQEWLQRIGKAA